MWGSAARDAGMPGEIPKLCFWCKTLNDEVGKSFAGKQRRGSMSSEAKLDLNPRLIVI